ncbi:MAG: hypothetical protein JW820_00780 [Spirochaetales bacterium]|nr:hypothetical protein [Spirochaetales bacterium]
MKLKPVPWLACALLLASAASAAAQATVYTRYTLRLEELELARHRLVVELPGVRFVYLEELLGLQSVERRLGIALPVALAGPVAPAGLWRQLFSPLGRGPAGTAAEEATTLRLDGSLEASSRRGIVVLADARARASLQGGLAVMRTDRVPLQGGGWLAWDSPGRGAVEALALYSLPPSDSAQETWYLPSAPYPGAGLLHLAARLGACGPAWADPAPGPARGRLVLSWAGLLSGGVLVPPGVCSELHARWEAASFLLALAGGVSSPEYRSPQGELAVRQLHGGVRLGLEGETRSRPSPPRRARWSLESEIEAATHHSRAALRGGEHAGGYELRASAVLGLEAEAAAGVTLRFGVEGEGQRRRLGCGASESRGSVLLNAGAENGRARLEAELGWQGAQGDGDSVFLEVRGAWAHDRGEDSLRLRASVRGPAAASTRSSPCLLAGGLRWTAEREGRTLFLDLQTPGELADTLGVSVGWEVRARR